MTAVFLTLTVFGQGGGGYVEGAAGAPVPSGGGGWGIGVALSFASAAHDAASDFSSVSPVGRRSAPPPPFE